MTLHLIVFASLMFSLVQETEFSDQKVSKILLLLSNQEVIGDIEPSKEQRSRAALLLAKRQEEMKKLSEMARNLTVPGPQLADRIKKVDRDCFDSIFRVLLPHQQNRILQLIAQQDLNSVSGSYSIYLMKKADKELEITPAQKSELQAIRKKKLELLYKKAREFRDEVEEIVNQEKEESLMILSAKQSELLKNKLGDNYKGPGFRYWAATIVHNFLSDENSISEKKDD